MSGHGEDNSNATWHQLDIGNDRMDWDHVPEEDRWGVFGPEGDIVRQMETSSESEPEVKPVARPVLW